MRESDLAVQPVHDVGINLSQGQAALCDSAAVGARTKLVVLRL